MMKLKRVYPPRHPASLDNAPTGSTTASRDGTREPPLPHEQDEGARSQARTTPEQEKMGRKAYDNATDGTADTDRGPVLDKVYNEHVTRHRRPAAPRR